MKTTARILDTLLIAWLCLFSMGDIKSIPDLVLCIGKDGHVEVEAAVDRHCGGSEMMAAAPVLAAEDESHCGECSDIPIYSEAARAHSQRHSAGSRSDALLAGALASARETQSPLPRGLATRIPPGPMASPSLAAIASVRILV
jgi:hypothetical protein